MNTELLDWSILGPAFIAGLLVLSTHVPLGQQVLKRGIIFIDLAIAQMAGVGVLAAGVFGWETRGLAVQVSAVTAALLASVSLRWTEQHWPDAQEPLIGIVFVLAATASILLLAQNPHGTEHLKDLLVGQILWVTWGGLLPVAAVYAAILITWSVRGEQMGRFGFYLSFAFAVTASVQLVGVYLVFASLIIPALATRRLEGRARLLAGYGIGGASFLGGIVLSALVDLPTGAVTVWVMAGISTVAGFAVGRRVRRRYR